jgi:hypothetical protein
MTHLRRRVRPNVRAVALPPEDLTVTMLRFAASAVTLAVAVMLMLAS